MTNVATIMITNATLNAAFIFGQIIHIFYHCYVKNLVFNNSLLSKNCFSFPD
jgi:hypothetical protein